MCRLSYLGNYEEQVVKFSFRVQNIYCINICINVCVVIKKYLKYFMFCASHKIRYGCIYLRMVKATLSLCICNGVWVCESKGPLILNLRMKFICLEFQASAVPGKISPNDHKIRNWVVRIKRREKYPTCNLVTMSATISHLPYMYRDWLSPILNFNYYWKCVVNWWSTWDEHFHLSGTDILREGEVWIEHWAVSIRNVKSKIHRFWRATQIPWSCSSRSVVTCGKQSIYRTWCWAPAGWPALNTTITEQTVSLTFTLNCISTACRPLKDKEEQVQYSFLGRWL